MDTVWIAHPNLGERKVEVPKSSLAHHQRAGWDVTDPPPPPPLPEPDPDPDADPSEKTTEAPADAGASALPAEPLPQGRRVSKGDK